MNGLLSRVDSHLLRCLRPPARRLFATALTLGVMLACGATAARATSLYTEDFSYANASALVGQGGWAAHSGAGTNPVTVASPGLSYAGFAGSGIGGMVGTMATSGEDVNHTFTTQSSGSLYTSFLVNVQSAATAGDYCLNFMSIPTSTLFYSRLYIKKDAANNAFGLGVRFSSGGTVPYTATNLVFGQTYLVVLKYTFVAGTANDVVSLYVNPSVGAPEPAATLTHSATDGAVADAASGLGTIAMRQGSASTSPTQQFDGIRIGTTWADVVGATITHTITASAGAGGTIAPSGAVVVVDGANSSYAITPNACFSIADMLVDGVSVGAVASYSFTNVTVNHTIAASFSANGPSTIAASAGTGGSISPAGNTAVSCGGGQAYTIAPDACHTIANILVDGGSVGAVANYSFSNVTTNHTIAASFAAIPFTITATPGSGGTITPNGAVVVGCGSNQAFGIAPQVGYALTDVLADGVSVGAVTTYTFTNVTANHTLSASFAAIPTIIAVQPSATTICPSQTCVTLPVTLSRGMPVPVLGFSITLQLSANLALCAGTSSLSEGTFLSNAGPTLFKVTDAGGGAYTIDDVALGAACGPTALSGLLFSLDVTSSAPSGPGSVTITSLKLRGCDNTPLSSTIGALASVVIDGQGPAVTIVSPAGGEVWSTGSSHAIQWTATDNTGVGTIDLAYSSDGGATFPNVIASGLTHTGSYNWTVPATSTQIYVRVTAHDVVCSSSNATSGVVGIQSVLGVGGPVASTDLQPVIPNPARGRALLNYSIATRGNVSLSITSVDGRHVRDVARGALEPGRYSFSWDGTDEHGARVGSGIYFVRLETQGLTRTRVINLVR